MKKLLTILFLALFMFCKVNAEEKVKVYMFEAGGCPYCEKEEEYLKGLEGYGTKFELIKKELYVDHVDWEKGKDYELGKKVAETFADKGFEDASYEGTPFVVISDIYAAASYNTELEGFINKALEEGDKDAVSCINDGKDNCVRANQNALEDLSADASGSSKSGIVLAVLGGIILIGAIIYVVKHKPEIVEEVEETKKEEVKEEDNKKEVKKEIKKTTSKPASKKTSTKKSSTRKTTTKK